MKIHKTILEAVGNTPLVQINKLTQGVKSKIFAKVESLNPGGSVKDRIGRYIIDEAEKSGKLKPGGTIVEATSGNTGFGLAIVAAVRGYKMIFVMPDKMSQEKIHNLRAFGARVVITPTDVPPEDPRSYYSVSRKIAEETPNAFYADQYHNPQNPRAHYETTGPEIWKQTNGKVDTFVCGLGTGGTASGVGKYLKEQNPKIKVVGADPIGSVYYEYFKTQKLGKAQTYKVEGIGEDFIPSTMDFKYVDDVIQVNDKESLLMTRKLLTREGLFVGGSSGAAVCGALKYASTLKKPENIVVLLPDSGDRYLSKVFNDDWMRENGFLDEVAYGTAKEILRKKSAAPSDLVTSHHKAQISELIQLMKAHGISQIPVVEESGKLIGMVTESQVLDYLMESKHKPGDSIEKVLSTSFVRVSPDDTFDAISERIGKNKSVIVEDSGKPKGIITKIDLISYYSQQKQTSR